MAEEAVHFNNRGFRTNEAEEVYLGKENTIDRGPETAYSTSGKKMPGTNSTGQQDGA